MNTSEAIKEKQFIFPESKITLAPGEHYTGVILGKEGESSYHLILLPGEKDEIKWADAVAWAKEQGGELPDRREQALLYANLKEEFKESWYWSGEQRASDSDAAGCQDFCNGYQYYFRKYHELRARAVRRLLVIQ